MFLFLFFFSPPGSSVFLPHTDMYKYTEQKNKTVCIGEKKPYPSLYNLSLSTYVVGGGGGGHVVISS